MILAKKGGNIDDKQTNVID